MKINAVKKVLFVSGSIGMGHVTRDLAIAKELRKRNPDVEISWLADQPAGQAIKDAGENLLPEADKYSNLTLVYEKTANGFRYNFVKGALKLGMKWSRQRYAVFQEATRREQFDLVIGDEANEIIMMFKQNPNLKKVPFVFITDFIGYGSTTNNPLEKLVDYYMNSSLYSKKDLKRPPAEMDMCLFVGEEEDIPDTKIGFMLPRTREWARACCKFIGYVFQFDPAEYADKEKVRASLGYGKESLAICSIGGTAIGKELLLLCGRSYSLVREKLPGFRMILVYGPRFSAESLDVPQGVEVKGYVPNLYQHFAASDLAIVQGGGTTTMELTALRRPFLYFPLEQHYEQQILVAGALKRHGAGINMTYSRTTPESLAEAIISNIGKEVTYAPIPTDGAQKAAQLIGQLL
jgi:UDP:flavonoid glycosyltransferase YjiC (YdhE family)